MANDYYSRLSEMNPGELADGLAIEQELDAIARGFAKLPVPHRDGLGFEGPVKVGFPEQADDAVQKQQLDQHIEGGNQHSISSIAGLSDALAGKQSANPVLSAIAQATMGAFSHRNLLINGDFRIWQRSNAGANITAANAYIADRWLVSVGGTIAVSINPPSARSDGRNVLVITGVTAGASSTAMQRIEATNVAHLVGRTVTFSVEVHSNAARSCALYIAKPAGTTKDDWSSSAGGTQVEAKVISVTGAVTRFSITHTVTNDDVKNGISVQVYTGSLAVNDYVALSEAQFEEGSAATPFERRPYGYELSLCQRYYEEVHAFINAGAWSAPGYKVTKRVAASVTRLSGATISQVGTGAPEAAELLGGSTGAVRISATAEL